MIGFYLTTKGEYNPEQVADISNSIILDTSNKTFTAMNQYVFEFQKSSSDYKVETLPIDSSTKTCLSIHGAKLMYDDLFGTIDTHEENAIVHITAAERTAWNNASDNAHTHSNKALLDGITEASVADWVRDTSYGHGTLAQLNAGTDETAQVWDASTITQYVNSLVSGGVNFRGSFNPTNEQIDDTADTLTSKGEKKGDMYIANTAGTYLGKSLDIGDVIVFKSACAAGTAPTAEKITVIQGVVKVIAENPTLTYDTSAKIGTVEGVDLWVKMPAMSVSLSVPTGLTVTGSPVTGTGTLAIVYTDGYSIPTDSSQNDWQTAYSWGNHADVGYALQTYVVDVSTRLNNVSTNLRDVSVRLYNVSQSISNVSTMLSDRITNVSTYAYNVSVNLAEKDASLNERIDNVSSYAISVSTNLNATQAALGARIDNVSSYAYDLSTNVTSINYNLTGRIANVSIGVQNVSTYAVDVSSRLSATNSSINTKFGMVDSSLVNFDSSVRDVYQELYEWTQVWAAAWNQLFDVNPGLNRPTNGI